MLDPADHRPISIRIPLVFDCQRLSDVLCTAIESGISYWCESAFVLQYPKNKKRSDYEWPLYQVPFSNCHNGRIVLCEFDAYAQKQKNHTINRRKLIAGLRLLANDYPDYATDILNETYDANSADAWIQLCVFKEIKYG